MMLSFLFLSKGCRSQRFNDVNNIVQIIKWLNQMTLKYCFGAEGTARWQSIRLSVSWVQSKNTKTSLTHSLSQTNQLKLAHF